MIQNFYIGCLKIKYNSIQELIVDQFDRKFLDSILPIINEVNIKISFVDKIDIPENINYSLTDFLIKNINDYEYRYYINKDNNCEIMSCMDENKNIEVNILESRKDIIMQQMRPWFNIHIERLLLWNKALLLHSASIIYRGEAILFTAPSGTGKSTQANLWHNHIDGVFDLNSDRTLLQKTDNGWYACGYPKYGSILACEQKAVFFKAIVIIRQAKEDRIIELSPIEKISLLYSECTIMRFYEEDVNDAMNLLEDLVSHVKVIKFECTKEVTAVETLYKYLYGE